MDLITPTDHQRPYPWAAVLLAHAFLGLWGWLALCFTVSPVFGAVVAPLAYLIAWEGGVQRFGAGLRDALADTVAVAFGPAMGLVAMIFALAVTRHVDWLDTLQRPVPPSPAALWAFGMVSGALVAVLAAGVWRRTE